MAKAPKPNHRFTYGDQFDEEKTPLRNLLDLCVLHEGDRDKLQEAIRGSYFPEHGNADNSKKMAMNCLLSLKAYQLIQFTDTTGKRYANTRLCLELKNIADDNEMFRRFATHILTDLHGLLLLRTIENIRARGEQTTLEYIGDELNDQGLSIPSNSTYVSTMRSWLAKGGVFRAKDYEINWNIVYDLLHMDDEAINTILGLTPEQKYYLLALVCLAPEEYIPSNKVAVQARSRYSIRLSTKNLVSEILQPIEERGFIETRKATTGRGAKPHDVRLTEKGRHELLKPLLESLAKSTLLPSADLNRTFEDVAADLKNPDKYLRGIALELFAVWLVRLLGLRFSKWRLRSFHETGGAEVDVLAASDKIIYNRWQIQCKNIRGVVDVDTVAKEVGLTFLTKADVVMLVTTSDFSRDAVNYANQVMDSTRYYIILLGGEDLKQIIQDRSQLVEILNVKARRVFAKKELGVTEFGASLTSDTLAEDEIGQEIAEEAETLFNPNDAGPSSINPS